jgi:transketolase
MRDAFASELTALAAADPRVVLLSGDIGNRLFDAFKAASPERFYNCGVAEANMVGVAAGMAMTGLRPVVYTITPFVTTRCLEQIRDDVCYPRAPVVLVGVGSGLGYASLGPTHHSCEEVAALRALPNLSILAPGDPLEVRAALSAALAHPGPTYIRMGKKGEPTVHSERPELVIGRGIVVRHGQDVALLVAGTLLPEVVRLAELLSAAGVSPHVVSLHTIKPLDVELLEDCFGRFRVVATIEEHSIIGGMGGAVAEWLCDRGGARARLLRFGTQDRFLDEAGGTRHARVRFGLTAEVMSERILDAVLPATTR